MTRTNSSQAVLFCYILHASWRRVLAWLSFICWDLECSQSFYLSLLVKQKAYVAIPSLAIHTFSEVIRRKGVCSYLIESEGVWALNVKTFFFKTVSNRPFPLQIWVLPTLIVKHLMSFGMNQSNTTLTSDSFFFLLAIGIFYFTFSYLLLGFTCASSWHLQTSNISLMLAFSDMISSKQDHFYSLIKYIIQGLF